jgi:hypothetical protein
MLARYQDRSAQAELRTAVILLSAAGVRATLELPPEGMPEVLPASLRAELRSGVARILADDRARNCVIAVIPAGLAGGPDLLVAPQFAIET